MSAVKLTTPNPITARHGVKTRRSARAVKRSVIASCRGLRGGRRYDSCLWLFALASPPPAVLQPSEGDDYDIKGGQGHQPHAEILHDSVGLVPDEDQQHS